MEIRTFVKKIGVIVAMFLLMLSIASTECSVYAQTVKLNRKSATVYVGKTLQLKVKNTKKKVKWSSSKKKIATVSSKGKVTAKKPGKVTITAKVNNKKYKCKITVKKRTHLSSSKITLTYGEKAPLKLLYPTKKVAWFSSNKNIVYADGKHVIAKAVGIETITAKCNGKSYTCKVIVTSGEDTEIFENGVYTSKDKVALYIHTYHQLPDNFITKSQAQALGWNGGSLIPYDSKKCIGGDIFSNYEGDLPDKEGRIYYECDINTLGALQRGAERIVYSNDGLIYYTSDHYETFVCLYDGV